MPQPPSSDTSSAITEGHYLERGRSIDATPATRLERTLRPVDPDGSLLAAAVREGELLAALDEERETGYEAIAWARPR